MTLLEDFAEAIRRGNSSKIQSWIDNGLIDVNARLPSFENPPALVYAVDCKQKEIVDILLRANARIDDADDKSMTPCHAAAESGREDVLALLLARRPNLDVTDRWLGRTPLGASVAVANNGRISAMLIEAGALDHTSRDDMCRLAGHSTVVIQALLNRGVVVSDLCDKDAFTPLHWAATLEQFNPAVLSMLANERGVNLDARNRNGDTCSHLAARLGRVPQLRWFIDAGAIVDIVNSRGLAPLREACVYLHVKGTLVLLAAGANVHARSHRGESALRQVISGVDVGLSKDRAMPIFHTLIAGGAEIDIADMDGVIPRQLMAAHGVVIDEAEVDIARRRIAKERIDFVRSRALQVCIGLQSLRLDALQMCEILQHSCGPVAPLIPFHIWWNIATTAKHFSCHAANNKD
jgi:ankyrin repeat protein